MPPAGRGGPRGPRIRRPARLPNGPELGGRRIVQIEGHCRPRGRGKITSELFLRIARPETLYRAWRQVRRKGGGPGGDGVTIEIYGRDVEARLSRLARLLVAGRYRPGPMRRFGVPKSSGGVRQIAVPCIADRIVQTAVVRELQPSLEPRLGDASFAYRRGLSVEHAIARLLVYRLWGYPWLLEADIVRCFDSIPHGRLASELAEWIDCERTRDLIGMWLEAFSRRGRGIPQGAPVSPLLVNLYLDPVDRAVATRRAKLVRYADDLVVACRRREQAEAAKERLERALAARGLALAADKTRILHISEGLAFLGYRMRGTRIFRRTDRTGTAF